MRADFPPRWMTGYPKQGFLLGEYIPPLTVDDLLREIDLMTAPQPEQDTGIAAWLETNEPSLGLVYALDNFGFFRRQAGSRRAGKAAAKASEVAAWERAKAAGLFD